MFTWRVTKIEKIKTPYKITLRLVYKTEFERDFSFRLYQFSQYYEVFYFR